MAKGKKGKKNSNLTDEERFQKEQEKAAAEEAERIGMGAQTDKPTILKPMMHRS